MDDFNFFLKLAKPLVLNLPDPKDRAMASLWLKKLCEPSSDPADVTSDNINVEFLKLLLFVMQGNELSGIFEKPPPSGSLNQLLQSGQRKAKDMLPLVKRRVVSESGEETIFSKSHSRVVTSIGGDIREYVAIQEIPNFGIHGYYAVSTEPMSKWSNPQDSIQESKRNLQRACKKNTCDNLLVKNSKDHNSNEETIDNESRANSDEKTKNDLVKMTSKNDKQQEKTRHSVKSLRKIFQAQRSEIAGVETRPSWGRSRYIERLIDESPHFVGDLDLSEADALLHLYRDRKMRKINIAEAEGGRKACTISSRRREAERRLDLPHCATIPDEDDFTRQEISEFTESRICLPWNVDSEEIESASNSLQDYDVPLNEEDQYESELIETRDYDNWRDYVYESCDGGNILSKMGNSYFPTSPMTRSRVDPETLTDMRRLVEDPDRREPPSGGKVKAPRRKSRVIIDEGANIESWAPQANSTNVQQ